MSDGEFLPSEVFDFSVGKTELREPSSATWRSESKQRCNALVREAEEFLGSLRSSLRSTAMSYEKQQKFFLIVLEFNCESIISSAVFADSGNLSDHLCSFHELEGVLMN